MVFARILQRCNDLEPGQRSVDRPAGRHIGVLASSAPGSIHARRDGSGSPGRRMGGADGPGEARHQADRPSVATACSVTGTIHGRKTGRRIRRPGKAQPIEISPSNNNPKEV
jgi:hypothetical protein